MGEYKGACSCGNIEYRFEDEPINSAFCYCTECQKITGSDKWFGLWVPAAKFSFTNGKPARFSRLGESGEAVIHHFCPDCGTTLCAEVTVADIYSVAASTLTDNNRFSPNMAIYARSAPAWAVFPDGVPKYDTLPPGLGS